ncbi:hypothetical protein CDO51_07740 [Natranaerobius trueperi]|uniref:EamA domain-containing protein n=2 Tax=Natranaerobius trueperi TaxID=759412 RepID=A0A226BZ45_9FIRM|nr:hypothetical protein CDO51_07740 [Natranaerobius trueperi]
MCLAIYSIIGRKERSNVSLLTYTFWLYFLSALFLLPIAINDFQLKFGSQEIIAITGLTLFTTPLGHTIYNAALRKVRSFYPCIISTQEVTGGILLGIIFLNEIPTRETIIGAMISLIGIIIIVYHSHHQRQHQ